VKNHLKNSGRVRRFGIALVGLSLSLSAWSAASREAAADPASLGHREETCSLTENQPADALAHFSPLQVGATGDSDTTEPPGFPCSGKLCTLCAEGGSVCVVIHPKKDLCICQ
jgi:hypothetical protein